MSTFIAVVLRETCEIEVILINEPTFTKLRRSIDADVIEYVRIDSDDAALMIDEEGFERPLNHNASQLAGVPIHGDAMVVSMEHVDSLPFK